MQPYQVQGPYFPRPTFRQVAFSLLVNILSIIAIGSLLAYSALGAAGWL